MDGGVGRKWRREVEERLEERRGQEEDVASPPVVC
jgi:hypothetical protein